MLFLVNLCRYQKRLDVITVSPHLRANIIQGKDINLATLLLLSPAADWKMVDCGDVAVLLKTSDPRLQHNLSFGEFVIAFRLYRDILCQSYPESREELDLYLAMMADFSQRYRVHCFTITTSHFLHNFLRKTTGQLQILNCSSVISAAKKAWLVLSVALTFTRLHSALKHSQAMIRPLSTVLTPFKQQMSQNLMAFLYVFNSMNLSVPILIVNLLTFVIRARIHSAPEISLFTPVQTCNPQ